MAEGNEQIVLRCGQCNKPFDKQSTLKRHGYYCRSRRNGTTIRRRSCIACVKGKARCDNKQPECSRCMNKAVACQYPANSPKSRESRTERSDNTVLEQPGTTLASVADSLVVGSRLETNNNDVALLDSALVLSDQDFINLTGGHLNGDDLQINFAEFLNSPLHEEFQYPSFEARHSTLSTAQLGQIQRQGSSSLDISMPKVPSHTRRSLFERAKTQSGAQRVAKLIQHTLKSYPMMMLRHNTLPPFIHPGLFSSDVEKQYMEPLTNCISLLHLFGSDILGSRKLFWKNVRLECERICAEQLKLNRWELLAALQALAIYLIMRLDEGEKEYNNFDTLLLATVVAISRQVMCGGSTCDAHSALYKNNLEMNWKDWIYEESCRRVGIIYQIFDMLVYFEPAAMCDLQTEFVLAPLPAKRRLWEAEDRLMWKAEMEKESGKQTAFGLAGSGDLVKLERHQCFSDAELPHGSLKYRHSSFSTANWEEWCLEMDGFGGLIMLAASLVV